MALVVDTTSREDEVAKTLPLLEASPATVCCAGALSSPLERGPADDLAGLLKAVADPVRLQLLSIIRAADGQEACVCDLTPAVGLSQPTVSHHLKVLTDAGLLRRERRASWAWYSLVPSRLADVGSIFT